MSGIITGAYFKRYFAGPGEAEPSSLALGTMVAVLEVGAFSEHLHPFIRIALISC